MLDTVTPPDDTRLHAALVDDLDSGFAALVTEHADVVHAVARRSLDRSAGQAPADAEDLAAEAFLRAYRALRGYDAERIRGLALRPWLLTIVVNLARNQRRDAARRPATDAVDAPPERPSPGPGVEEVVENAALGDRLAVLLADLPEAQRTAGVLRHVVDLPVDEIAAVLGCAAGTARSHISRGLAALRATASLEG